MAKYHITAKGEPGVCRARPGNCPLGDELEHYTTPQDAMTAFEKVMSGTTWTGFENDKAWGKRSWDSRKKELTRFARDLAEIFLPDEMKIAPEWVGAIHPTLKIAGSILWVETEKNSGVFLPKSFRLSEFMENLDEETARDVILHELAHLKARTVHGDAGDHGEEWMQAFDELRASIKHPRKARSRTLISSEEYARIETRSTVKPEARWNVICVNGHSFYLDYKPPVRGPCSSCHTINPAFWQITDRRK